jgi:hypothetical protein
MSEPVDLLFGRLPLANPADLVFGEGNTSSTDVTATLSGSMPPLTLSAELAPFEEASFLGTLPALTLVAAASYASQTSRPTVGSRVARHEQAQPVEAGLQQGHQEATALPAGWQDRATYGEGTVGGVVSAFALGDRTPSDASSAYTQAARVGLWPTATDFQSARAAHTSSGSDFKTGAPIYASRASGQQDADRSARRAATVGYRQAAGLHWSILHRHTQAAEAGLLHGNRYQRAVPPNGGPYVPPIVPPGPDLCYTPNPHLVFAAPWSSNTSLLFFCENHGGTPNPEPPPATVVVPIKSVYIVINDIILRRVSNGLALPTLSLSLSIDADSWTWGFSASLPAESLDAVLPGANGPIELEAVINGTSYRLLAESVARERQFGRASVRVSGRGRNSILAAPYAPVLTFANSQQRTAQQLMADVLTVNGQSLGWSIDWTPTDWLVPAGAFNVQGSYIDGLNAIAGAAGAYLQPHPTAQTMRVLLRYPIAPWAWNTATPDYEIPSAVMTREAIEWVDKPEYNRVFVSGTSQGVLAQVTRDGTAGDLVAPMVTDPLITASDAGRQRGIAVLSDTGRQATVRLSLPVLPETGVITPGKFVRYVDGATTRLGLVRAVGVESSGSSANLRQSITLETHL